MNPIPSVLAILVCDQIIIEQGTDKKTLIGVFDNLNAPQAPIAPRIAFYARLTDARGEYHLVIRLVYLGDVEEAVGIIEIKPVCVEDRRDKIDIALNLPSIVFPKFGRYEFQLFADDVYIGRATIDARQFRPQQGSLM